MQITKSAQIVEEVCFMSLSLSKTKPDAQHPRPGGPPLRNEPKKNPEVGHRTGERRIDEQK
jgi:hypothetical protein